MASTDPHKVDKSRGLQHLWNATMDGAYPELRPGGEAIARAWFDLLADARHWELEPYFDLDGGRGTALEDVEYLVYIEKPAGPIEVSVEKHGYDVYWIDPATGVPDIRRVEGDDFK